MRHVRQMWFDVLALAVTALSIGCACSDYPIITDDRGDYSGVIRTGHKAYIVPSVSVAQVWDDGSDELFTMVEQNRYGDQKLYAFNNFDPTASVVFLDQTYCDWRFGGCEVVRCWNPHQDAVDDPFDYELFRDCSGFRSLGLLLSQSTRVGECGDAFRGRGAQQLATEFARLATTTWRGDLAYIVPISADTTSIRLGNDLVPILGQQMAFLDARLRAAIPVTPSARHTLQWVLQWTKQHDTRTTISVTYGSFSTSVRARFIPDGLAYDLTRF